MADNVAITEGSGKNIATNDIGGVQHQVIKVGLGEAGALDGHLDAGQQSMASSLPVTIASDQSDVDVAVTSVVPGTSATSLGKAEDAVHTDGDTGVMALSVRKDTAAPLAGTDGDYQPVLTDASGYLWVHERNSQAMAADLTTIAGGAAGDVAHDGADSGNPIKVGGKAIAHGANPSAVAAGDRTDLYANRHGIPFMIGGHPNIVTVRANSASAQTNVVVITAGGAGNKIVVTSCDAMLSADCSVNVDVRVGFGAAATPTTTGVVLSHPAMVKGSGIQRGNGSGILGVGADNENLYVTNTVPTGGDIDILVSYYKIES